MYMNMYTCIYRALKNIPIDVCLMHLPTSQSQNTQPHICICLAKYPAAYMYMSVYVYEIIYTYIYIMLRRTTDI